MIQNLVRPPVVVVLGHVDHGKTTLLDYLRKTNQTTKEIGDITQTIGAYEIITSIKGYLNLKITFIDTPGHEVFSQLRSRGAQIADIAILMVDAVDSVMPQTIEAFSHIKNAQIPFIVAVNKIDLPQANLDKVKNDLVTNGIVVEGMGGDAPVVGISAKTGLGIDDLLETILIIASEKKTVFSPVNDMRGVIIEVKKDKQGIVVSVILKDGCLKIGDTFYYNHDRIKVKTLIDDRGKTQPVVYPSTPFLLSGFESLPIIGTEISSKTQLQTIVSTLPAPVDKHSSSFLKTMLVKKEEKKQLKIIIKTNTQGSLDVIKESIAKNNHVEIMMAAVGEIAKSDVFLAKITQAVIIGFALVVDKTVQAVAEQEKVVIKTYNLIYQLLEELTEVSNLISEKETKIKQLKGEAKILAQFIIDKEKVAGVKLTKGKLTINDQIEINRGDRVIGRAKIVSVQIRAKSVNEIKKNEEAGLIFYPQLDFITGDMIKSYSI